MHYSVTGTTEFKVMHHISTLNRALKGLEEVESFTTGGAKGVDVWAAALAVELYPDAVHRIIVPDAPYDVEAVQGILQTYPDCDLRVHAAPARKSRSAAYMARNDLLVAACDVLLAFPKTAAEELRSGTWATIRRARKRGIPVRINPLNGRS